MNVKCSHCGNEQEYSLRNGKIPKRPKTQCKNEACKKFFYISIDQINDQKDQKDDQKDDQTETKNDQKTVKKAENPKNNDQTDDQMTKSMTKKRPKKLQDKSMINHGLDYRALLTAVNNYLVGFRKAYKNAKDNPLSETKLKYETMQKQKKILEGLK